MEWLSLPFRWLLLRSPEQAAENLIFACCSPALDGVTGQFLGDPDQAPKKDEPNANTHPQPSTGPAVIRNNAKEVLTGDRAERGRDIGSKASFDAVLGQALLEVIHIHSLHIRGVFTRFLFLVSCSGGDAHTTTFTTLDLYFMP